MASRRIAVVGAGTGGLAASIFLKRSAHQVTLFERFERPKAVGAGIVLQPTGLAVLAQLGLEEEIINRSCKVFEIDGK